MLDFIEVWKFISTGGLPALVLFILWAGYKQYWVFGSHYQFALEIVSQLKEERDKLLIDSRIGQDNVEKLLAVLSGNNRGGSN